jgi:hypothetical protein
MRPTDASVSPTIQRGLEAGKMTLLCAAVCFPRETETRAAPANAAARPTARIQPALELTGWSRRGFHAATRKIPAQRR